ncbi:uncharacterized protein isoform X3 [Rhodnius prolixus]|uniref:uncharacterized protein isoform X3 n=1 Tax=Rhodnius prolixus TaxID=13249 RepID=UPI003D187AAD
MHRYEAMKPKHGDYYISEPVYYSREWYSPNAGAGDIITTDSEPYIEKLQPKTIYIPRKKKPAYLRYTSPRYVRKEPMKIIRSTSNSLYPIIHEYKPTSKHLKPVEVIRRPYLKHSATYIEDSTSIDENSISQYSKDVEALLQQYERVFDDTLISEYEKRITNSNSQRNLSGVNNRRIIKPEKLTSEQLRILSMDKPPLDKLKEIPVQYLKPRLPPYLKEQRKTQPSEEKKPNEPEKIEVNTEDLLKGLFHDMALKGLTGLGREPIIKRVDEINLTSNEKLICSSNPDVGTQTMNNDGGCNIKLNKTQSNIEEKKDKYSTKSPLIQNNKQENNQSNHPAYPDLSNLEEFLDKSIKFDLSISSNGFQNNDKTNDIHTCPNCNVEPNSLRKNGSGDTFNEKDHQFSNENSLNKELKIGEKIDHDLLMNSKHTLENNKKQEIDPQITSLRECLSDLTHSRKQDKLDYNNKSNKYKNYNKWQYNNILFNDDKILYPSKENYQISSTESNETQPFSVKSGHDTIVIDSKEHLGCQTSNLSTKETENLPHTKNVFGLPSVNTKLRPNIPASSREITVNTVTTCQPIAGGDSIDNQKKILSLLDGFFTEKRIDDDNIKSMDLLSEKMAQLDSSLCVEIMRRLTETLINHQPNSLSSNSEKCTFNIGETKIANQTTYKRSSSRASFYSSKQARDVRKHLKTTLHEILVYHRWMAFLQNLLYTNS